MQIPDIAFALQHSQSSGSQSAQQEPSGEQNTEERKSATYLDREKLQTINEISRLIRVLETLDPKLAKELIRYREAVANESASFTKDIAKVIQQALRKEPQNMEDLQKVAREILQSANKNIEIPPETKLLIALKQNDFPAAAVAIKRLIQPLPMPLPQQILPQIPQSQPQQIQIPAGQPTQVIQQPQPLPQLQQPLPTQNLQTAPLQTPQVSQTAQTPQISQVPQGQLQQQQIQVPANQPTQVIQQPQNQPQPSPLQPQQPLPTQNLQTPPQTAQAPQIPQVPQGQPPPPLQPLSPLPIPPAQIPLQTPHLQPQPQQIQAPVNQPAQVIQQPQPLPNQNLQTPPQTPQQAPQVSQTVQAPQIPQVPQGQLQQPSLPPTQAVQTPLQTPQLQTPHLQPQPQPQQIQVPANQPALVIQQPQIQPQAQQPLPTQPLQIQQNQTLPIQPPQTQSLSSINTFQTLLGALQELKVLGTPSELNQEHLKQLEHIVLQKTGIEIPKNVAQKLEVYFSEKPQFATTTISPKEIELRPLPQQSAQITPTIKFPLQGNFPVLNFLPVNEQKEIAFTLHNTENNNKAILQPWPTSVDLPKNELNYWLKTELPITPEIIQLKNFFPQKEKLPEPSQMRAFATALHEMSLQVPNGQEIEKEKINLLQRIILNNNLNNNPGQPTSMAQILPSLLRYRAAENHEGELFKTLPEPVKNEILKELQNLGKEQHKVKVSSPQQMEKIIEKVLTNSTHINLKEEHVQTLRQFKEQLQWTRLDQETKPPQEREHIFYFAHQGELQKGRLQVKDNRKGNAKKSKDNVLRFSIETKTKNLGAVHADLVLNKSTLNINLTDEIGTANESVQKERETLAKELSDIGLALGELNYGKTPKKQNIRITDKSKPTGKLNVLA